jgi:hypothetical protein
LGLLPDDEADKIEQLALLFPEVEVEINNIRHTIFDVNEKAEVTPAPEVREKLINTIRKLKEEEDRVAPIIPTATAEDTNKIEETARVVNMQTKSGRTSWLAAASVVLMVVSIGTAVYLYNRTSNTQNQLAAVQTELNTVQQVNQQQQQQLQSYAQSLAVIQDPAVKKMELKAIPGKTSGSVQLFWHTNTHEVFVGNMSLPPVPNGKQYQLWAIVKGVPVDAGMLNEREKAMQKMKAFQEADAFAITLENKGGSSSPSMDQMFVMSKTS